MEPRENEIARGLLGQSPEISSIRRLIEKASRNRLPVLILGESGTGKEVVARAIHAAKPRGQFVPIDCGSLVDTLMESELFGHTKGSFPRGAIKGSHSRRAGRVPETAEEAIGHTTAPAAED